jgi:glycosyltransferase involved in cell wall biosynthesis
MSATAPPLRVALDVTQIDNQHIGSGQFRYAVDLLDGLCGLDAPLELTLLGSTATPAAEFAATIERVPGRCRYVEMPRYHGRGYVYRDIARLTWWLATHAIDVYHQIHTNLPLVSRARVVVTAHHYFHDAPLFASRPFRYYRWALRARTDLVITVSDATRDDFHRHFGLPLDRMRTVHHGLSPSLAPAAARDERSRYLLSPYNLSEPKNLRSLILAWPTIAERDAGLELVLFGRALVTPEREAAFDALVRDLPHGDRIRRVGHVSDEALAALYDRCVLFVFPTTVEGFGYPLLEAMAHGACCITRDASAMKEIGGDAVRLVETLHPQAIADAAIALLADPVTRRLLGERARDRAATFTIEAMARNTLACYRSVVT